MATKELNTTNPDSLTYQNEILKLTALGGIRLEGLDRMRVTLKAELTGSPRPPPDSSSFERSGNEDARKQIPPQTWRSMSK